MKQYEVISERGISRIIEAETFINRKDYTEFLIDWEVVARIDTVGNSIFDTEHLISSTSLETLD